jgi:hypothetical protein
MTFRSFGDPDDPAARERRQYRESLAPLRKLGQPEDVAEAVVFLAGPGASHITGTELTVDGGASLTTMPGSHGSAHIPRLASSRAYPDRAGGSRAGNPRL